MAEPRLAQDRLAFLIALVSYLPDGEPVPITEAAAHFGVDADHVRRSIQLIAVSGIPGETAAYQPGDLFDIDWDALELHDEIVLTNRVAIDDAPRLSAREAAALIAGLQSIGHLPELEHSATLDGLIKKLARGTSGVPSAVAVNALQSTPTARSLMSAISAGRTVAFDYRTPHGQVQRRTVDPLRIESIDADVYLRGWCHLRLAARTFRIDRITGLEVLQTPVAHTAAELDEPSSIFSGAGVGADLAPATEVTVEFDASGAALIADYAPRHLETDAATGRSVAVVALSHPDVVWRIMAELPEAVVIDPPTARAAVAARAADALDRYRRADLPASGNTE